MRRAPGNDLTLGKMAGRDAAISFPRTLRDKHLYICGSTGTGKSKLLEHLIRQDIVAWRKSKCGVMVLDPHGTLYDNLMEWLAWNKIERPIVPIDLRRDDWVVSYNVLRQRTADPAVLVDNFTDAMAYVWGQGGTDKTPLFARWAGNVLRALYEKKLTLVEAQYLVDRVAKQVRFALTSDLKEKLDRQDWEFADTLNAKDFEAQIGSTVNRLQRFIRNQTMRNMFGQPSVSLDLGKAIEDGAIILVSLATERAKVSKENAELFATLLLSDLWTAAQERGKRDGVKPFYVYLDEFQRFVTPTISDNLDEARGFGLHLTMAHQFPNQLLDRGENGRRVYNSIMENASSKIVFRLTHEDNLMVMAKWLFMGVIDPDEIKHELYSTKVMEYREEKRTNRSMSKSSSVGGEEFSGNTATNSKSGLISNSGGVIYDDQKEDPNAWNESEADSGGTSRTRTESESESETESTILIPVMGKELAHVQFRTLDEQVHRAMAVLFDQQERRGVARLVGMKAPISIVTPHVQKPPPAKQIIERYLMSCYEKLPFALPSAKAEKQIKDREQEFADGLFESAAEPTTARRKLVRPDTKAANQNPPISAPIVDRTANPKRKTP